MTAYTDFEVRVRASRPGEPGPYSVDVTAPAEIEGAPFTLPGAAAEINALLVRYANETAGADELREFGRALGAALFSARPANLLGKVQGKGPLRLRLRIDPPELAAWPWELLILPGERDFAALAPRVAISRYLPLDQPSRLIAVEDALEVLVVCAEPQDLVAIDTAATTERVRRALAPLGHRARVRVIEHATWLALQEALDTTTHVLHFAGHGNFDHKTGRGVLAFESADGSDWITTQTFAELLYNRGVHVAYLDACHSGTHEQSVAHALVAAGVPAVLAMRGAVVDADAQACAAGFYRALVEGQPVDAAAALARLALAREGPAAWSLLALFMRARDGQLFATERHGPPPPFQVEPLPADFVPRPAEHEALVASLQAFSQDPTLSIQHSSIAALTTAYAGAGGYGKTTLARAVCHDSRVRAAYPDGVLWVTLGQRPGELTGRVLNCIEALSGARPGYTSVEPAAERLERELAERACLLVVDDVWDAEHIKPFVRGGPGCARLVTTRVSKVLPKGANVINVDAMRLEEAVALLGAGLPVDAPTSELRSLAALLGEWPLLLRLVNGALRDRIKRHGQDLPVALDHVRRSLDRYGLTAFDARKPQAREQAAAATFGASLEQLEPDEHTRFAELAIFPEDVDVPLAAVQHLWGVAAGLDDLDIERLCERVDDLGLLLRLDLRAHTLRLHDVTRQYLMGTQRARLPTLHARFLDAYSFARWVDLPRDELYLWQHLAYHLHEAGRRKELYELLTSTDEWLRRKFEVCQGDTAYVEDLELAMRDFADSLPSAEALAALVRLHGARQVVRARISVYTNELLRALVWLGRGEEALSHARLRDKPHQRFDGLMAIQKALQARGLPQHDLLGEAAETARSIPDVGGRARALVDVAAALAQTGDPRAAMLFDQATEATRGISPDYERPHVVAALATALTQAGRSDQATDATRGIFSNYKRPHQVAALATALTQAGRSDQAAEAARSTFDAGTRARALAALAAAFAQASDPRAVTLFNQAAEAARSIPSADYRASVLVDVASAFAQASDPRAVMLFDQAAEAARSIPSAYYRASVLIDVAAALVQAGGPRATALIDQASDIIHNLPDDSFRAHTLVHLAATLAQSGSLDQAAAVALSISSDNDRAAALTHLAATFAQAGDPRAAALFDQASDAAYSITSTNNRTRTLANLAIACAQAGDPRATTLFNQASDAARSITSADNHTRALADLAAAFAQIGDPRSTALFNQASDAACNITIDSGDSGIETLLYLTITFAQAGHLDKAAAAARSIPNDSVFRNDALTALATALAQAGHFNKAAAAARSIPDPYLRAHALTSLATALAQAHDSRAAVFFTQAADAARNTSSYGAVADLTEALAQVKRFDQAAALAFTIIRDRDRVKALTHLATALIQVDDPRARTFFDQAAEAARSISDDDDRARALTDLAAALAQVGDLRAAALFDQAAEAARSISDDDHRARALTDLAAALARAGHSCAALQALGPRTPDDFIAALATWAQQPPAAGPRIEAEILLDAVRIVGWIDPNWRGIAE
jgi:tetratricopeptide (TPR) repeat protein